MPVEGGPDSDFWDKELEGIDTELPDSPKQNTLEQVFGNKLRHIEESNGREHLLLLGLLDQWVADSPNPLKKGGKLDSWEIIRGHIAHMALTKGITDEEFIDYVFRPEEFDGRYNSEKMMLRFLI